MRKSNIGMSQNRYILKCGLCATYCAAENNGEVDQSLGDTFQQHKIKKLKLEKSRKIEK